MENTDLKWRTASYSSNGGGNCVEIGQALGLVAVRDTKDNGAGPVLGFAPEAWAAFVRVVKN
jgi:hypothetical protein